MECGFVEAQGSGRQADHISRLERPGNLARELGELIRGVRAKVNLIALNPGPGIAFETPAENRVLEFQKVLIAAGVPAFVRRPRGRDIYAACGQLKRTVEVTGP